ncbi:MAG: sulfatase [Candidatus Glassbacteria bacterium]
MKFNERKVLSPIFTLLIVNLLIKTFTNKTLKSLVFRFFRKIPRLMNEEKSFPVIIDLFKKHVFPFLVVISCMIAIVLLYYLLRRINFGRASIIINSKLIRKCSLYFFIAMAVLNLSMKVDSRVCSPDGPNVVLIIVDTLRADHLGCYGYGSKTTPHIDALSLDSIVFKNAICPAPWTSPSVGSIITSQYPTVLGFEDTAIKFSDKFITLAEIFRDNNYETKGIISHTLISSALGFDQGFDSYDERNAKGHDYISSPSVTQKAISYVREHRDSRFLLFLHYFDPHYNYIQHVRYDYYPGYRGPLYSDQSIVELRRIAPTLTSDDIDYLKALYDSEISFTDEYIGEFIYRLKELGLYNNTLIVFTADHGEEFSERGDHWIGHTKTLYQELIHVPLMIKLPDSSKHEIIDEYVGLIDLMPTIVEYAGLEIPKQYTYEGEIIDISNMDESGNRMIFSETRKRSELQSVVWRGWKLIYDEQENTSQLFNLQDDSRELKDVAFENDAVSEEMKKFLERWQLSAQSKKSPTKPKQPDFTDEQLEYLRSMGYIQ